MSLVDAGLWHLLVMPLGEFAVCFISAILFPYNSFSAKTEYESVNGRDYYSELKDSDLIGRIKAPGFKQTYDRIIEGILFDLVTSGDELNRFGAKIYSKNFYPISSHTKSEVLAHLIDAIDEMSYNSAYGYSLNKRANKNIKLLFNSYVSVMSIHEEATRRIEQLKNDMVY